MIRANIRPSGRARMMSIADANQDAEVVSDMMPRLYTAL